MTDFDEFWGHAKSWRGRHSNGGRPKAQQAWERVVKAGADPQQIVAGALGYESAMYDIDTRCEFWCMASTFLNQYRWVQYRDEAAAKRYLARHGERKFEVVSS